ncbi:MAG: hypothetical protein E7029_06885 [Planctomycetaceae bacterium]|nr:hypothetical protein [Planctomycetaceae bacterium]
MSSSPENKDVLLIKVDWNGRLQPGAALSPKFTFSGVGLQFPVSVSCKMERFATAGWDEEPEMYPVPGGKGWYFQQPLTIPNDLLPGTYFINVRAVFQKEDPFLPGSFNSLTYHAPIQFDIGQNNAAGPLVIRATGNALINMRNYDWNRYEREIVIEADENAIINLSKNLYAASADQNTAPKEDDGNDAAGNTKPWLFKFEPIGAGVNPPPRDTLLLTAEVNGKVYFYHICAKPSVVLGRGHNRKNIDYVYRYYRESDDDLNASTASMFFSRSHLNIKVGNLADLTDGLTFTSLGKWGTKIVCDAYEPKEVTLSMSVPNSKYKLSDLLKDPLEIVLAECGYLEMKGYCDPGTGALGQVLQGNVQNPMAVNPFWQIGTNAGVDVLVLKRQKGLTFSEKMKKKAKESIDNDEMTKAQNGNYQPRTLNLEDPCWENDPYCDTDTYLFILRAAVIGTASGSIAPPNAASMALRHAAIYFYGNRFGLVNYDINPINYKFQGTSTPLQNGQCRPLEPGMDFDIGNVKFHVFESYCSWLRMQRNRRKHEENEKAITERLKTQSQTSSTENVSQATL